MASGSAVDLGQLTPVQLEALHQYTDVTSQDVNDAIPLLQRSQWNVQVCSTESSPSRPSPAGSPAANRDRRLQ